MNKTIIGLIIAGILLISIPIGVRLVQMQQVVKSRAAEIPTTCTYDTENPDNNGLNQCPDGNLYCEGNETWQCTGGYCDKDSTCKRWCHAVGNSLNCGSVTSTPTPPPGGGGNCLDRTTPPDGNPNNCPGRTWRQIWDEMKAAGYGYGTSTCTTTEILSKYLANPVNQAKCSGSGGGGGSCPLDPKFQTPSLDNDQLTCVLRKNSGLVNAIKNAIDQPSNPSRYISCTDLQLVNFWCNNDIGRQNCAKDKDSCGGAGGTGPSGAGLSCNVTVPGSVSRGGSIPYEVTIPDSFKDSSRILELTYNYGQLEKETDWINKITCNTASSQPCKGEFITTSIPSTAAQIRVKCDVKPADSTAEISASNACSGNSLLGNTIGVGSSTGQFPGWVSCGPNSHPTVSFVAEAVPTVAPTPTQAPSPTPTACNAQALLSLDGSSNWTKTLKDSNFIALGTPVYIGGFFNGNTSTPSSDIDDVRITGPAGSSYSGNYGFKVNNDKNYIVKSGNTFTFTMPAGQTNYTGTYTVTAINNNANCANTATFNISQPVATTVQYRVSENKADFTLADNNPVAPWVPYTDGILANYTIRDRNPGTKSIYVQFEDSNGNRGGCGSNKKDPCMMEIKYLDSARISNCSISIDGSNTILNLTGDNFGITQGSGNVKGTIIAGSTEGTGLSVITWEDNLVSVKWSNAPQGKTLYVTLTTANKQKMPGTCSPVSQLALSTKVFCQAISATNCAKNNVNLAIKDVATGDIVVNKTVSINPDGVVTGLNQKLEAKKTPYILSIKAPKSLRRNREFTVTTDTGGTTNIMDFVLPMGDIFDPGTPVGRTPIGEGKGFIGLSDYSALIRDWNISTDAGGRAGDLNCDSKVNAVDWGCLRHDYNMKSDPALVPGVDLVNPYVTPIPGTTGTPAPGQPGACTLGMYVIFNGINNAAFTASPIVTLGLFPAPAGVIKPDSNPECLGCHGHLINSGVTVTPSTDLNKPNVYLITSGTYPLTCGDSYDVVVKAAQQGGTGAPTYKYARFDNIPVVNTAQYPSFILSNETLCLTSERGSCNHKCLDNDPCCPYNANVGLWGKCFY